MIRGAGTENVQAAMSHAGDIVTVEQALGVYVERSVQQAFEAVPYAPALLGLLYVALHFAGTAVALTWIHRRHPDRFPIVRTTFVVATALALVGYVFFPTAPPRLAELGFSDTVTRSTGLDLSSDLLGALYNPFAAVPSLHFGYALIVGVALATVAERRVLRLLGALYPAAMLLVIVATGNHFFVDAALGGLAVGVGWLAARGDEHRAGPSAGAGPLRRPLGHRCGQPHRPRHSAARRRPAMVRAALLPAAVKLLRDWSWYPSLARVAVAARARAPGRGHAGGPVHVHVHVRAPRGARDATTGPITIRVTPE